MQSNQLLETLQSILSEDFGGDRYKVYTLEGMNNLVKKKVNEVKGNVKGSMISIVDRMVKKLESATTREQFLTILSETMFSLH